MTVVVNVFARFEFSSNEIMYAVRDLAVNFLVFLLIIRTAVECDLGANRKKVSIRSLDVEKTKIWGPGLEPHKIVLPVRYFYIQAIDGHGKP